MVGAGKCHSQVNKGIFIMLFNAIHRFLKTEAKGSIILFIAALAALIISNSVFAEGYQSLLETSFEFKMAGLVVSKTVLSWINEGLMTIFFLLVGLELKRECLIGHLSEFQKRVLPAVSAFGGMMVPALIYAMITWRHNAALQGWAVPVATDIAFALGVLSIFGKRIPLGLRLFLMTLAIFDDVGAIIIIAVFQAHELSWISIFLAGTILLFLFILNRVGVQRLWIYLIFGVLLWVCVLQSGVHATVAGMLIALTMPIHHQKGEDISSLERLEKILQPWAAYFVMPVFAFANAGLPLKGLSLRLLIDPVTLGIVTGLFIGKQCGVFGFAWLMIQSGWAKLPERVTWLQLYGVALLCGIGFTMSLFIGTLAFQDEAPLYLIKVRAGVLLASLLSGILGALVLRFAVDTTHKPMNNELL